MDEIITDEISKEEIDDKTVIPEEITEDTPDTPTEIVENGAAIDEVKALKEKIAALEDQLNEKSEKYERMSRELGEFSELFGETNILTIPDEVWQSVRGGVPLAAAYALYEKQMSKRALEAEIVNQKNRNLSTGSIGKSAEEGFYTPDEVRAMSRGEVRKNYSKIIESMQKWN